MSLRKYINKVTESKIINRSSYKRDNNPNRSALNRMIHKNSLAVVR